MADEGWVKLSVWAKGQGVSYQTARRMFHNDQLPDNMQAKQLPTGTLMVRVVEGQPQLDRIEAKLDRVLEVVEQTS